MQQSYKSGQELREAVEALSFDFSMEPGVSGLPSELQGLFEQSGKRFRPALCYLFGELYGIPEHKLRLYARAVEMTHTASLVHDDVIDHASERRKIPTLNHQHGNTTAVLAGDYLLAKVIGDLLREAPLPIITDLTDAIKELADGEWLQHRLKVRFSATPAELAQVARKKTGSLMVWSCVAPAKLANASATELGICRAMGDDIGLFFQMLDDVNDFNPASGKPYAQDLLNGQLNFVTAALLQTHPGLREGLATYKGGTPVWREALTDAIQAAYREACVLERDLNGRFEGLARGRAPHLVPVFAKMLVKVRESFLPQGLG